MDDCNKALLWAAITDIDLQVYKASVYKLRWDTPGSGLDLGLPALEEARATLLEVGEWPVELQESVAVLQKVLDEYIKLLEARDHTSASAQQTRLMISINNLRAELRDL